MGKESFLNRGRLLACLTAFLFVCIFVLLLPFSAEAKEKETGWKQDGKKWYYYEDTYKVAVGWRQIGKKWYYFNKKGEMYTGWLKYEKVWFYLKSDGSMAKGWLKIKNKYYFFDQDGVMAEREYRQGYWLTKSGAWDNGKKKAGWKKDGKGWWYQDRGWYPKNRWLWVDGKCYYFYSNGYLATATTIKGSKVNASGAWVSEWGDYVLSKHSVGKSSEGTTTHVIAKDVTPYSYEVIPLLEPFNEWYYIMTDNPDPSTFAFKDANTKYVDEESTYGTISPTTTIYADVVYENTATGRVAGGYIAYGSGVDGGELTLCSRVFDPDDEEAAIWGGAYKMVDTKVKVTVPTLVDSTDYMLQTYTKKGADFFDNMDALQNGLNSICLYSGAWVLGDLGKDTEYPYYGITASPHVDQNFYIQDPYYRTNSKSMFVSELYPYRLDSLGFPGFMGSLALEMDPNAKVEWSQDAHYIIHVTRNGVTKSYGGAGWGGGKGINKNQIKYWYRFDGSKKDSCQNITMMNLRTMLNDYGSMEVPDDPGMDIPELTWKDVKKTVGDGAYVKIHTLGFLGLGSEVYTYLYDDGSEYEGSNGFVSIGHFSNAWFEGRYFNKYEYIYPGAEFMDTVENVQPSLVFRNFEMKLPDDGRTYYWDWEPVSESEYDSSTGTWKGYTTFDYDAETKTWVANDFKGRIYYLDDDGNEVYLNSAEFLDKITITMDEAKAMKLDSNTNVDPKEFYRYTQDVVPGTKGSN